MVYMASYFTFVISSSDIGNLTIRLNAIPCHSLLNGFIG